MVIFYLLCDIILSKLPIGCLISLNFQTIAVSMEMLDTLEVINVSKYTKPQFDRWLTLQVYILVDKAPALQLGG